MFNIMTIVTNRPEEGGYLSVQAGEQLEISLANPPPKKKGHTKSAF